MRLAKLFKQGPRYEEARQKLTAAVDACQISEETDVASALRLVFGPPDSFPPNESIDIVVAIMTHAPEFGIPARNVRELLWLLERVDREHERKHKNPATADGPPTTD